MKKLLTALTVITTSPAVLAHDTQTLSSATATLVHQLTAPDHILPVVAVLALAVYSPAIYRRIRNRK